MNRHIIAACSAAALAVGTLHPLPSLAGDTADLRRSIEAALPMLDVIAEALVAEGATPGLSIAIVHDDRVVYLKGFGLRDIGSPERVSADTVFPLASVSKSISATVIAALVSDGVVSWDTRMAALDPLLRLYDPYVTGEVTIRDLFAHRSGLSGNAGNDLQLIGYSRRDILDRVHLLMPVAGFREAFAYSNFGLTIGALAAATAADQPWEQIAQDRLFTPLSMTSTSARFDDFVVRPDRATIHTLVDGAWQAGPPHNSDVWSPAGGVSSSARDMATWMRLILNNGSLDGEQIIAAEALAETHKPMIAGGVHPITGNTAFYGLGWAIETDGFGLHWNHNGAVTSGVRTLVDLLPASDLGILVLANGYPSGAPEAIVSSFHDLVFTGELSQDWVTLYQGLFKSEFEQFVRTVAQPLSSRPAIPTSALPLPSYVGTYANEYVGEARVIDENGVLLIALGPDGAKRFPLIHFDRDTFLFTPIPETPQLRLPVLFTIGQTQQAIELQIGMIGGSDQSHLRRTE